MDSSELRKSTQSRSDFQVWIFTWYYRFFKGETLLSRAFYIPLFLFLTNIFHAFLAQSTHLLLKAKNLIFTQLSQKLPCNKD